MLVGTRYMYDYICFNRLHVIQIQKKNSVTTIVGTQKKNTFFFYYKYKPSHKKYLKNSIKKSNSKTNSKSRSP